MLSVINYSHTPLWQEITKRVVDIVVSACALVLLSPLILYVIVRVKLSSPGPVFYAQERVGLHRKKFFIYKFRSMVRDAESNGPRLTHPDDQRITAWGKIMRRWKLDELPQLWNVLAGDMSLVGPRPEREYFIQRLENINQPYEPLLQVKPGITSMGMTRFGYAGNLEEMMERMKYDLVYLEKRSLALDLKIMIDTIGVVFAAKGK